MSPITPPKIDPQTAMEIFQRLRAMVPHYVREWPAKDDDDPGVALLSIFSFVADGVIQRLNRAPERNLLCFLDMLGIRLLPETPATVAVRFLMGKGVTEPAFVAAGTQLSAAATAEHPELSFETSAPLLAVPAALVAVFALDPTRDLILKPPPGFLDLDTMSTTHPTARVVAFSSANSSSFQLDTVDQLQKGDFLMISGAASRASKSGCCTAQPATFRTDPDYLIISDIKGRIVFVTNPLPRDYPEGTVVEKVTRFSLGEGRNFQEHVLYLAHADVFNVKSSATFELEVSHTPGSTAGLQPLRIAWEFFGNTETEKEDGWHAFNLAVDGPLGLSSDGRIRLTKPVGEIKETELNQLKNRWIRARLLDPLAPTLPPALPRLESIVLSVRSAQDGLIPDRAFYNDAPLDLNVLTKPPLEKVDGAESTALKPFGSEPRTFDSFYLASEEAFSKRGAGITMALEVTPILLSRQVTPGGTEESLSPIDPQLSWEYWNGTGWVALAVQGTPPDKQGTERARTLNDGFNVLRFVASGTIRFLVPEDMSNTEVAGQDSYWIRARLVGGDYGHQVFYNSRSEKFEVDPKQVRVPQVTRLLIHYSYTQHVDPQACLTFNNLSFLDQTAANVTPDKYFAPFEPLPVTNPAVYFGFDNDFQNGPVRLYAAARELEVDEQNRLKLDWDFQGENDWRPLVAEDRTKAFTRPDLITWTIPEPFGRRERFGASLCWVRATLVEGTWNASPSLSGLFFNTTMARQERTFLNEILGSSDGTAGQVFQFIHLPVLENEEIRVREALTDEERTQLLNADKNSVREFQALDGQALETWVLWSEVQEFFDSTEDSRHYRLDRATGELSFGDGKHGRIPPAGGDNIRAFRYQAECQGKMGNVPAGAIRTLVTSIGGVDSVVNPVDAGAGSDRAQPEQMLEIGPEQISHRGRAVTPEDFESLAREASREVRKARCVPNRNGQGRREAGWVSVFIVPDSSDPMPMPSLELRRAVTRYLAERSDVNVAAQERIAVGPPEYAPIGIRTTIFARSLDDTALAEANVKTRLKEFLHPLTGGPAGQGWDFGSGLPVSAIYRLLEDIEEVDHVGSIELLGGGQQSPERIDIGANALIAPGDHLITVTVAT